MREKSRSKGRFRRGIHILLTLLVILSALGVTAFAEQGGRHVVNQFFDSAPTPTPPPQPTPTPGGGGYDTINITVNKVWSGDTGDVRPASVQVQLYRNGSARGNPVTLNSGNSWRHTWYSLSEGFSYTVEEVDVPTGYTAMISRSGNTFTLTNTYGVPVTPTPPPSPTPPPAITSVTVRKEWVGDGEHPTSVEAVLYKNGTAFDVVTLFASNNWTNTWTDLDPSAKWTVGEKEVPEGYDAKVDNLGGGVFVITNTKKLEPKAGTVLISGTKTWRHGTNPESQQPTSIVIYIKANGVTVKEVTLHYETGWSYELLMPKFDENGTEITYTIEEQKVSGYTAVVRGFGLTNIHASGGDGGPKTGDNSTLWLWFVLLLASSALLRFLLRDVALFRKKGQS